MGLVQVDPTEKVPEYSVSKWLYLQCLISVDELRNLMEALGHPSLYPNGKVVGRDEFQIDEESFVVEYQKYLESLSHEESCSITAIAMSRDEKSVYSVRVKEDGYLIKPRYPVIQIREHRFLLTHDGRYQSKGFSQGSVRFGLQFAFPQVFVDPDDGTIRHLIREGGYPNVELFKDLQKWIRRATKPTPMIHEGKKENCTFRIGKSIGDDLSVHADLKRIGLSVEGEFE